jgi:hypothetical protein
MQLYTVYFYLETALHVTGSTSTYHQERKQLYLQHLVFVTPLLLSAARSQVAAASDLRLRPRIRWDWPATVIASFYFPYSRVLWTNSHEEVNQICCQSLSVSIDCF